jgi:hypothetical protein
LLAQLPEEKRRPFAEAILEESEEPLVLGYVRLNIEARADKCVDFGAARSS